MSAEFETGFFARQPAWHGMGTYLGGDVPLEDALKVAELDWRVRIVPNYLPGEKRIVTLDGEMQEVTLQGDLVPNDYSVVRDIDNRVLGKSVGRLYEVLQNQEVVDFAKAILTESSGALVDTAGSLRNGEIIWFLIKLQDMPYKVKGVDEIAPYLLLTNSHNGQRSFRVFPTTVRVVCANTLTLALGGGRGKGISIQHSGDMEAKLAEAQKVLENADSQLNRFYQQAELLAGKSMKDKEVDTFIKALFPGGKKKKSKRTEDNREAVLLNWHSGGADVEFISGIEKTAWEALNAVTAYTNHGRDISSSKDAEDDTSSAKVDSLWFGTASALNQKALLYLTTFASGNDPSNILQA